MHACSSPAVNIPSSDILGLFIVSLIMVSMCFYYLGMYWTYSPLIMDQHHTSFIEERGWMGVPLGPEYWDGCCIKSFDALIVLASAL